jgi:putative two-component system response regulator
MAEEAKVLFLDDEESVLRCLRRQFMDDQFVMVTCTNGIDALDILKSGEISVVISDNLMPGMQGVEFFQKAKHISPDTVRIMLTGFIDVHVAVDAINKGEVYKFLTKPWDNDELRNIILDSIERHRVVKTMKRADEYSLRSLAQTIELKDPYTKGHCDRVAAYACSIAEAMGLDESTKENIRRGSWLHDCGKIGIPEAILNYPGPLSNEQMKIVRKHPCWGGEVARLAHLPEEIVNVILYHHERYDGAGYPSGLEGERIPLEARIVNVADIYDALTSHRPYRSSMTIAKAEEILRQNRGVYSDPVLVDIFLTILGRTG